jgi:predicted DCC family thiol-disulfide oxidoreductase YuxK
MTIPLTQDNRVLFFDHECLLCNGFIRFILKQDSTQVLKVTALKGETAKTLLSLELKQSLGETVIYYRKGRLYSESSAVLMVLSDLGRFWKATRVLLIFPKAIRDGLYRLIARNRYRIFRKQTVCSLPKFSEKKRLLP